MDILSLSAAAKLIPGNRTHTTVWRWIRIGVRANNGKRVYLKSRRAGGKLYTTAEWLGEFFDELEKADRDYFTR